MSAKPVETGIILSAGLSRRFGPENKLLASWRGQPLISYAIDAASKAALKNIILVTGQDGDAIAALANDAKIHRAHNPDFEKGLSSSLQVGLAAAPLGPVIVLLADMPMVGSPLINNLLRAWRDGVYALAPEYNGEAGNPVILSPAARQDAKTLTGDQGARGLFKGRTDIIRHPVANSAILHDFDLSGDFSS